MSQFKYTVVGDMDSSVEFGKVASTLHEANKALKAAGVPVKLQACDSVKPGEEKYVKQMRDAEGMLLDWLSDAEIGETSYIILTHMASAIKSLEDVKPVTPQVRTALRELYEGVRMQARYLIWIDDTCKAHDRPALGVSDRARLEEYSQ